MQNKKTFVLDTSTLLYNASSIRSFGSKNVVIPYPVLEELDRFKTREGEIGRNARQVVRELDELRKKNKLSEGVEVTSKGGTLSVILCRESSSSFLDMSLADDRILSICLQLKEKFEHTESKPEVVLVTKDINLAVKAEAIGLQAQDFTSDKLVESVSDLYKGSLLAKVPSFTIDSLHSGESMYTYELEEAIGEYFEHLQPNLYPNQYVLLKATDDFNKQILVRAAEPGENIKIIHSKKRMSWGVTPRNLEQNFAFDALMDENIPLVTLVGMAGSGKTILALACALEQVHDLGVYDRLVVSRPVQPMGKDIGYLPGSVEEKLDPWMGPVKDAINFLTKSKELNNGVYEHMIETGMLEIEALTYIRGRSIPNTLFLLDEAQDLSRAEIKTIISRMGENSKLIITGDVMQISNPYLDPTNTGLASVVERFKEQKVAAHVTLEKGERSILATIASEIL
jgi:PhoH-like ATPase